MAGSRPASRRVALEKPHSLLWPVSPAVRAGRSVDKWPLGPLLLFTDKSEKGTKVVACWEAEEGDEEGRDGNRVRRPQEGVTLVSRPAVD